jgi:hypothetical protein
MAEPLLSRLDDTAASWLLDRAIAILREAEEIRMPVICAEDADGRIVVKERRLFAVVRSDAVAGEASVASPLDRDSDIL